jgi:Fanconi anaemia protein FancD2 nuclease
MQDDFNAILDKFEASAEGALCAQRRTGGTGVANARQEADEDHHEDVNNGDNDNDNDSDGDVVLVGPLGQRNANGNGGINAFRGNHAIRGNNVSRLKAFDVSSACERLSLLVDVLMSLISLTKEENMARKHILMTALREGGKFLDLFLSPKSGNLFSLLFAKKATFTLKLLSKLQRSTRQMYALCTHGKLVRDRQLAAEAPGIRKNLERFIFRMRSMVASSKYHNEKSVWVSYESYELTWCYLI